MCPRVYSGPYHPHRSLLPFSSFIYHFLLAGLHCSPKYRGAGGYLTSLQANHGVIPHNDLFGDCISHIILISFKYLYVGCKETTLCGWRCRYPRYLRRCCREEKIPQCSGAVPSPVRHFHCFIAFISILLTKGSRHKKAGTSGRVGSADRNICVEQEWIDTNWIYVPLI